MANPAAKRTSNPGTIPGFFLPVTQPSIAFVHNLLYRSPDISSIGVRLLYRASSHLAADPSSTHKISSRKQVVEKVKPASPFALGAKPFTFNTLTCGKFCVG